MSVLLKHVRCAMSLRAAKMASMLRIGRHQDMMAVKMSGGGEEPSISYVFWVHTSLLLPEISVTLA